MLNTDEDILVLVDEAHRSHTNTAHANLMQALPNCVKVGFTGTPIIMRATGQTAKIFGDFVQSLRRSARGGCQDSGASVLLTSSEPFYAEAVHGSSRCTELPREGVHIGQLALADADILVNSVGAARVYK